MAKYVPPSLSTNFSTLATDPLRNFKFLVSINFSVPHQGVAASNQSSDGNLMKLGFTSVSGLSVTTESIPYRQGGYNTTVHQIPGQTTFTPITLQRGVLLGTGQPWQWMKMLFSVIAGNGTKTAGENFRAPTVDISVLQHPVTLNPNSSAAGPAKSGQITPVAMEFRVYNAWITSLSYSDLNAGDNALLVEQMTLVHEGFDVSLAGGTRSPNGFISSAPSFLY